MTIKVSSLIGNFVGAQTKKRGDIPKVSPRLGVTEWRRRSYLTSIIFRTARNLPASIRHR